MAEVSGFGAMIPGSEIKLDVFLNIFPKGANVCCHPDLSSGIEGFSGTLGGLKPLNNCLSLLIKLEDTTLECVVPKKDLKIVIQPAGKFVMFNPYNPNSPVWTLK